MSIFGHKSSRRGQFWLGLIAILIASGATWAIFLSQPHQAPVSGASAAQGDATSLGSVKTGPSGLPVPRFVSLKGSATNVRRGPSSDHDVLYTYQFKGLPVEITAESEHWRRIRDSEGSEGWVYYSLLSGKRTALIAPWKPGELFMLKQSATANAAPVAKLTSGVMAEVEQCSGAWCEISASGFDGFIEQNLLFGVYPGEQFGK